jgi:replicative DNA helicase
MLEHIRHDSGPVSGAKRPATDYDRLLPQNIEAEQSVLGAVLLDNEAIATVIEHLLPMIFTKIPTKIFIAMLEFMKRTSRLT